MSTSFLRRRKRLGEVLRESNAISPQTLQEALAQHESGAGRLGEVLLRRGSLTRKSLAAALEQVTGAAFLDARQLMPASELLELLPYDIARRHTALVVERHGRRLRVVMAEPQNLAAIDEIRFVTGMEIEPRIGLGDDIRAQIEAAYHGAVARTEKLTAVTGSAAEAQVEFICVARGRNRVRLRDEASSELQSDSTPAVRVVARVLAAASARGASDIHIEQAPDCTNVRLRVDGILHELTSVPDSMRNSLVSRIKILADLDIAERRMPQDGRFLVRIGEKSLDVRVSTLPTQFGEKIVLRLLDSTNSAANLNALGLDAEHVAALTAELRQPQGMVLVTGPTGSGKSTTLYGALNLMRGPAINITTVEDPVEYVIPGINQVQVHAKTGRTFAGVLRSILRQDPNVIMVGEIRDAETAEIALQAAQTGHMVLSTLHTNDSVAAVGRLLELKVAPFLIASSVSAIVAQRLARKLCACRSEEPATPEYLAELAAAGLTWATPASRFRPRGCEECGETGYRGRVGIFEILVLDDMLRNAILAGAADTELREMVRLHSVKLMPEHALQKVVSGLTSFEEVRRVVMFEKRSGRRCGRCAALASPGFGYCPHCGTRLVQADAPLSLHKRRGGARPRVVMQ